MAFSINGVDVKKIIESVFSTPKSRGKKKSTTHDFEKKEPIIKTPTWYIKGETKCWWDHNSFEWDAIVCPLSKKISPEGREIIDGEGVFCGLRCAKAYAIEHSKEPTYKESLHLISVMSITMRKTANVDPAPHWKRLEDHGGTVSLASFRTHAQPTNPTVNYVVLVQIFE